MEWTRVSPLRRLSGPASGGTTGVATELKVADETWIATALLHREHPERDDFAEQEIVARARNENFWAVYAQGSVFTPTLIA
jgi:hypothetical protein